jgi:hypothetical protein
MSLNHFKRTLILLLLLIPYAGLLAQDNRLRSLVSSNDVVFYSHTSRKDDGMPVGNGQLEVCWWEVRIV